MYARGFPPIADERARVLILGSLPGQRSLQMRQYYAQPYNAFWKIMGRLFSAGPELPYAERKQRLIDSRIALWDVCAAAHRPGSLDSSISHASVVTNGFARFLRSHPGILLICFNGSKAAELYRRSVLPDLPEALRGIATLPLPSTSPAHASMPFEEKLSRWSIVRDHARAKRRPNKHGRRIPERSSPSCGKIVGRVESK
ncbi:MAG: DNA-deoxyinosine glycosylase [Burkholderiales bacterium]